MPCPPVPKTTSEIVLPAAERQPRATVVKATGCKRLRTPAATPLTGACVITMTVLSDAEGSCPARLVPRPPLKLCCLLQELSHTQLLSRPARSRKSAKSSLCSRSKSQARPAAAKMMAGMTTPRILEALHSMLFHGQLVML